jgi:hypothetical protein
MQFCSYAVMQFIGKLTGIIALKILNKNTSDIYLKKQAVLFFT